MSTRHPALIGGIYAILDVGRWLAPHQVGPALEDLLDAGIQTVQLRAKGMTDRDLLELGRAVRGPTRAAGARLVINDRPDIAVLVGADGVHLGQTDLPPERVRTWLPEHIGIGLSCHNLSQIEAVRRDPALAAAIDYLGYGPIFPTSTKQKADPVVGLEALEAAVRLASPLPIVAIGGLTRDRLFAIRKAGAAAGAMAADLIASSNIRARALEARVAWSQGAV